MNSSVKSFVPSVSAGLPLPGCELEDELLDALGWRWSWSSRVVLPHAATTSAVTGRSGDGAKHSL